MIDKDKLREKIVDKELEYVSIKEEFKKVPKKNYAILILLLLFFLVSFLYVGNYVINNDNEFVVSVECNKSINCLGDCMDHYGNDGVNHSLECNYKCLTYKNC